jgi:flagellin-like hook-associated protein FlgL
MRISTNTIYAASAARLGDLQSGLVRAQQQISTGRRMLTPADDPVAAARALEVTQAQATNTQFATNRQNAKDSLNQEESTLQTVTGLLQDIQTMTVQAGDGTLTDTDRKSLATKLQGQYSAMLALANSVDGTGNYLFAGYETTSPPFLEKPNTAQYVGDQGQRLLQSGPAHKIAMSDTGNDVFERNRTGNGIFTTVANIANSGTGIISTGSTVPSGNGTSTPALLANFSFGQPFVPQVDGTSTPQAVTSYSFGTPTLPQVDGTSTPQPVTTFDFSVGTIPQVDGTSTPQPVTTFDFTVGAIPQVDGTSTPQAVTNFDFSLPAVPGVDGTSTPQTVTNFDFSAPPIPQVDGTNVQNGITGFNFSGAGLAQFDVNGQSVTLTTNTVDETGLAAAIQAQLTGITVTGVNGSGTLTFTNTGNTAPVAITSSDLNANTAGFANSGGTTGSAAVPAGTATFSVDGTPVTLNGADTDITGVAAELTTKMQASPLGANYSASIVGGQIVITQAGSPNPVVISGADANAIAAGITNSAGVAGIATIPPNDATFLVDGTPITLNGADTDITGVAAELTTKMQASPLGATYSASIVSGKIVITQTGSLAPVVISGADADANAAGITNSAGVPGIATIPPNDATFSVDGTPITLNGADTDITGVAAELTAKMQASPLGANYSASVVGGQIVITQAGSLAPVVISGSDADANAAGISDTAGVAGIPTIPPNDATFSVDGTPITLNGADTDITGVAAELTAKMQASPLGANYSASVVGGQIVITQAGSLAPVVISGSDADANAAGITDTAGVAGIPTIPPSDATFTVDGTPITLNANDTDITGVAAEMTAKMQASPLGASYSASIVGGQIIITRAGSLAPVVISGADADALAAGITNSAGVAGAAAIPTTNATFSVDGTAITLNGNDGTATGVAAEINAKLQASTLVDKANYSAAIAQGRLVITHIGTPTSVAISGADANAVAAGITNTPGVSGTAAALTGDSYRLDFAVSAGVTTYSVVDTTTGLTLSSGNPYTSGQSITFDSMQFDIQGNPANGDTFTVQPSINQSLFTTLKNLVGVLNTSATGSVGQAKLTNGLNTAMNNLSHALDNVLTVRSTVGARLNQIDDLNSNGSDKDVQYSETLSNLQDLDYTKAITQLTLQQTTLTAAQQTFVKISGLSLFNYL